MAFSLSLVTLRPPVSRGLPLAKVDIELSIHILTSIIETVNFQDRLLWGDFSAFIVGEKCASLIIYLKFFS